MPAHTEESFRRHLVDRGARRLKRVRFRANRSTIWSLTQDATALNVHVAYRGAPASVLDAFALIVRTRGRDGADYRRAARTVREWPGLVPVLRAVRTAHRNRAGCRRPRRPTACAGTPEQREYLRILYGYLNRTRFHGLLPDDLPVRLSRRMKSCLGHMVAGATTARGRRVHEIALNIDLMLPGNGAERMDTLLHEMAHAADYLFDGEYGHGPTWRAWARRAGCRAETRYDRPVVRRRRRGDPVTRVPPLPPALRRRAA